jgi:hypothetical protein
MARPSATGSPAAFDGLTAREGPARWTRLETGAIVGALLAAIVVRLLLLPTPGLRGDLDQFALWVHGIATDGLGNAYDQDLGFGPVMAYVWGALAALEPAFRTATDASDPTIRVLMKLPATLADFGVAALIWYALRERPRWAVVGAAAFLLHPAVVDVSAWWGQSESIYLLWGVGATICALNGRQGPAAALLALAILTKPQAMPFVIPFAAWFWVRGGIRGLLTAGVVGVVTGIVLWLPFIPAGGPLDYLGHLGVYQNDVFNILSLRAWNAWGLAQEALAGGRFLADDVALIGPLTLRHLGYGVTALGSAAIWLAIVRRPEPRTLVIGLAASSLLAFTFLTGMHERYAYPVLAFLLLAVTDRGLRWAGIVFGVVFTLNLLAAVPPTGEIGTLLPAEGPLAIVGSLVILGLTATLLGRLLGATAPARPGAASRAEPIDGSAAP